MDKSQASSVQSSSFRLPICMRQPYAYIRSKLLKFLPSQRAKDEFVFLRRFRKKFGYLPDFKHPQTFNEKIIHRILFDKNPLYTALADKLKARLYIAHTLAPLTASSASPERERERERETAHALDSETLTSQAPHSQTPHSDTPHSEAPNSQIPNHHTSASQISHSQNSNISESTQAHSFNSILSPTSPLFAPIDTLTPALLETNSCPYLPKLYGIYKSTQEIDFNSLPQSFVLKTNHDCGGVVLVPNKDEFLADSEIFNEAMTKLSKHLATNYYTDTREWHYNDIEPRIFAEELLGGAKENGGWEIPENYRMFCFARGMYIQVDDAEYHLSHKRWFYDEEWNFQHFTYNMSVLKDDILKPVGLDEMKIVAKKMARDMFVRVDLYVLDSAVYVGELTFTPCGGVGKFNPAEWDKKLGDLWV